eukprot:COSAG01_NODE_3246_length_6357_cov_4.131831_5_plen_135_part_00
MISSSLIITHRQLLLVSGGLLLQLDELCADGRALALVVIAQLLQQSAQALVLALEHARLRTRCLDVGGRLDLRDLRRLLQRRFLAPRLRQDRVAVGRERRGRGLVARQLLGGGLQLTRAVALLNISSQEQEAHK